MALTLPELDENRRRLGLGLYLLAQLVGGSLLLMVLLGPALFDARLFGAMCLGAALAIPAAAVYLTVPRLLDRYDPEPWYALVGCLLWGAITACGFSAVINTAAGALGTAIGGEGLGEFFSVVLSAPFTEEFFKGLGLFGMFVFLRREFDGVVDGIIYACFIALGFAMTENILYYARSAESGVLGMTFLMRGILFPWGHPVYTAMTGIGFGIARETQTPWKRYAAPIAGYGAAVFLHMLWNGSASFASSGVGVVVFVLLLPLWFLFVVGFLTLVIVLVRRRGKIIRQHLEDEVLIGNLTAAEVELIGSAFGVARARRRWGSTGVAFVRTAARLALSKWHSGRAQKSKTATISWELINPLRAKLQELRRQLR